MRFGSLTEQGQKADVKTGGDFAPIPNNLLTALQVLRNKTCKDYPELRTLGPVRLTLMVVQCDPRALGEQAPELVNCTLA